MSARMLLGNVSSFALQTAVLVVAGAALARALRIDEPRAMLAYWRALLLACLVLPLCQPWNTVAPPALTARTVTTAENVVAATVDAAPVPSRYAAWPISALVLSGLTAGIAARTLWLTIGAFGLRRLRRDASPLEPLPESIRHAQERIGTEAGMYVSDRVSGPITFGLRRPVILFPPSVSGMPSHVQEAVTYHELIHVRRRDWCHEILEEAVRSVLWFHPAIWWLIGRIQLTREQVVDQAAIQLIDSRERYVESLLAVALASSRKSFAPASPFLRRHLLKRRVARILQETTMTTRRLIASLAASAVALMLIGALAVRSFPLEAQGRAQPNDAEPIQLVSGGEHLLHGEPPVYPHRAIERKVQGDVVVEMTLNDRGEVSDARVVSGPEELRKATLEAVLQWHYSPAALSSTVTQAAVRFHLTDLLVKKAELSDNLQVAWAVTTDAEPVELRAKFFELKMAKAAASEHMEIEVEPEPLVSGKALSWKFVEPKRSLREMFEGAPPLADVRTERVPEATAKQLLAQAGVAVGDPITEETAKRIQLAALAMDEHFRVEFNKEKAGLVVTILAR